ncbi:glucitol operon repressor [Klebsiella michiganensis]|nr:glucitol operon repressor [Klebsiella michiganensis]
MTNGMNVANALLEADGVELLMTGGHLRRQSLSFYGDQAEQSLQNYHFDMLFLGVDAIDLERGVSTHNEDEARLNRRMCEVAERIIVVTDSTNSTVPACIRSSTLSGSIPSSLMMVSRQKAWRGCVRAALKSFW